MKKALLLTLLLLLNNLTYSEFSFADICFFGYTLDDAKDVIQLYDYYDMDPNVAVLFGRLSPEFDKTADAVSERGAKSIVMLQDLLFEVAIIQGADCSDYGSNLQVDGKPGLKLLDDWRSNLKNFIEPRKDYLNSGKVMMLVPVTEPNNSCIPTRQIEEFARYIKSLGIEKPLAISYDMWYQSEESKALPLPREFPVNIDIIAFYNYAVFDPNDPDNPLNPGGIWDRQWSDIKSRLGSRKVVLVLNSYCTNYTFNIQGWLVGCKDYSVNTYAALTYAWRDWALKEPAVVGIVAFGWDFDGSGHNFIGARDLPESIRNAQRSIIDSIDCSYAPDQ